MPETLEGTERGDEKYLSFFLGQGPGMDLNQHPDLEETDLGG